MALRSGEMENNFPISSSSNCDPSSNASNFTTRNSSTLRPFNFSCTENEFNSSISQQRTPRGDVTLTNENETSRDGFTRTSLLNCNSDSSRLEPNCNHPPTTMRQGFGNGRSINEDGERNEERRRDLSSNSANMSSSNGGRQRRSRNTRQPTSTPRRLASSAQNQDLSDASTRHPATNVNVANTTTSLSTNSNTVRNHNETLPVVQGVNPQMPINVPRQELPSAVGINTGAVVIGRENDASNTTNREPGRARSASGNRRRNRRRRRRARSAGNATSNRTNHQHLDQNELQRTSLAGNYNLPRGSTTNIQLSSGGNSTNRTNPSTTATTTPDGPEEEATKCQIRQWPHQFSFLFACLSCTVGMFSISRFALLTIEFGPIFIVQFLLLTLLFGIPLLLFFVSTGQYLGSGIIDMWRISPIFQGIGVALMLAQGLYGIYNIAIISWLFIYLRDSFVTASEQYRWSYCFKDAAYRRQCGVNMNNDTSRSYYENLGLEESVPDYFAGTVLLRTSPRYPQSFTGELRFQTLFNIVVIWMAVFIGLSKGVRSYGKVVYLFFFLKLTGFLIFAAKVIDVLPMNTFKHWISNTEWMEFIYNGESWVCAARECFFTWGLLGATMLQMASHNRFKQPLARDALIVVILTLSILILSGVIGVSTVSLINSVGYEYTASSFETFDSYEFLRRMHDGRRIMRGGRDLNTHGGNTIPFSNMPGNLAFENRFKNQHQFPSSAEPYHSYPYLSINTAPRPRADSEHISFLAGIRIIRPNKSPHKYSGYQVVRLATEIIPTYSALLGPRILSAFWVVMFYFTMIVFGLSQQMAIVHTVASGLISIRPDHFLQFESSLTFMSCLLGLVFSFPMATEFGEFIVYFFDYTIGCGWWMMVLYVLMLSAMFIIRGKPYSGENICTVLISPMANCIANILTSTLAFCWNVILPIGLMILSIVSFRFGRFAEMFDWTTNNGYQYLPSWVREIGAMMQVLPILMVPFVAVIQSCRYFLNSNGQERMHERVNNLYRPQFNSNSPRNRRNNQNRNRSGVVLTNFNQRSSRQGDGNGVNQERVDDPPPKYTPPPSYSTATGARIARFLRQSFRQSVRRFRGETSQSQEQLQPSTVEESLHSGNRVFPSARCKIAPVLEMFPPRISTLSTEAAEGNFPPPDYATVIIETSRQSSPPPTFDLYESTSLNNTLQGNHQRNAETTLSYLSESPRITLQSTPEALSRNEPSLSNLSNDNNKISNIHGARVISDSVCDQKFWKDPENFIIRSNKQQKQEDVSQTHAQLNSSIRDTEQPCNASLTREDNIGEYTKTSSITINGDNSFIDGAGADTGFESVKELNFEDEDELQTRCSNVTNGIDYCTDRDFSFKNFKSFDTETDNVVTEYTTIVVGKVLSPDTTSNRDTDDADETQTIYASLEHLNDQSIDSTNFVQSLSIPQKMSPSQDIQKEFEKDFCSVEEALSNGEELEMDGASTVNDERLGIGANDLENSRGVRITLNFNDDSSDDLLKYNSEFATSSVGCQDETDCDLLIDNGDVQISRSESDPPNRHITIIGSDSQEIYPSNAENDNARSVDQYEDNNAITLEIDTSTSVI